MDDIIRKQGGPERPYAIGSEAFRVAKETLTLDTQATFRCLATSSLCIPVDFFAAESRLEVLFAIISMGMMWTERQRPPLRLSLHHHPIFEQDSPVALA